MLKILQNFLKSIGLIPIREYQEPFDYNINDYDLSGEEEKDKIQLHKDFLLSVLQEENNRLSFVENKTTQIISQTSIIFSLVGLIIPIVIDKFDDVSFFIKLTLILLLMISFFMYLISIRNALKNLNIKKFKYPYANPENVITLKDKTIEEFNSELIRDYLYCIKKTILINNIKGTNLLHAYKSFKIANYFTGIIIIVICSLVLFTTQKEKISRVKIETPVKLIK